MYIFFFIFTPKESIMVNLSLKNILDNILFSEQYCYSCLKGGFGFCLFSNKFKGFHNIICSRFYSILDFYKKSIFFFQISEMVNSLVEMIDG